MWLSSPLPSGDLEEDTLAAIDWETLSSRIYWISHWGLQCGSQLESIHLFARLSHSMAKQVRSILKKGDAEEIVAEAKRIVEVRLGFA